MKQYDVSFQHKAMAVFLKLAGEPTAGNTLLDITWCLLFAYAHIW
jgi:hypothetical protein